MKKEGNGAIMFLGLIMILYAIMYALLGTLSLLGEITGVLPGHEEQEIIIVIWSYAIAIIAVIGGIACIRTKFDLARKIAVIFAIIGLASLIYVQLTQDMFNSFDCIAMVLGVGIYYLATISLKEEKELKTKKSTSTIKSTSTKKNTNKKKNTNTKKNTKKGK